MKTVERSLLPLLLSLACAHAAAQVSPAPARSQGETTSKLSEPQRAPTQKDLRAKPGTDLRLSLMPQKVKGSAGAAGAKVNVDSLDRSQGSVANVSDISGAESSPEHHLSAQDRHEMRLLLRQQRLKQQN